MYKIPILIKENKLLYVSNPLYWRRFQKQKCVTVSGIDIPIAIQIQLLACLNILM